MAVYCTACEIQIRGGDPQFVMCSCAEEPWLCKAEIDTCLNLRDLLVVGNGAVMLCRVVW